MEGSINDLPGVENGELRNISKLFETFEDEGLSGHADLHFSQDDKSGGYTIGFRNDTESQLYEFSGPNQTGKTITYVHNGTDAELNTTTGEVEYGEQYRADFVLLYASGLLSLTDILEWETAGTTVVDGEPRYVLEANSVNDTMAEQENSSIRSSNSTVDARLTVDSDGIIRSGDINITGKGEAKGQYLSMTISLDTSESIRVTQPDWYDEAEAESASS